MHQIWNEPRTRAKGFTSTMRGMVVSALRSGRQVWLTGHSMGGAVATTAAALLLCGRESQCLESLSELSVMTLNAPKALRKPDAERFGAAMEECGVQYRRMEHRADRVRFGPPGGYEHVGDEDLRGKGVMENPLVQGLLAVAGLVVFLAGFIAVGHAREAHSGEGMPEDENRTRRGQARRRG